MAPLATRVRTVSHQEGIDEVAALRRVAQVDDERRAFLRRCFHVDADDPSAFDMQVSTGALGVESAAMTICAAVQARPAPRVHEAQRLVVQAR